MLTPLDDGLVFSSILREDDAVFKVFMVLASRADEDEIARVSADFLGSVTRKTPTEIEACLKVLEAPDATSRTTTDDGRRIERVNGGFRILNVAKYRAKLMEEAERAAARERKREWRAGTAQRTDTPHPLLEGRKDEVIRQCYALIREIAKLDTSRDPTEILLDASKWLDGSGRARTRVRLETMTDDHLIRTLADLKADLAKLHKEPEADGGA